ncbi:DUF2252 domain-containing protein [Niallia sp. 03190]|uniref:DUF2252 domain-containing protein n=1 Tax=Niallia sp. 03190 TaxID=3458061 RepID=UPI004043CD91
MENNWLTKVRDTRTMLRQHVLETIFQQMDDEVIGLNLEQRLDKYQQMMESPFRFYRGSAYLFYYDMTKIPFSYHTPTDKSTWIQGDLHFENFGAFQNEKGDIIFDVNDFDEGYIGSYVYDLLRMTVSISLICEALELSVEEQEKRIHTYIKSYYKQMKRFNKKKDNPVTLFFSKKNTEGPVQKILKKLENRKSSQLLEELTVINEHKQRRFVYSDEIQPVEQEERFALEEAWESYIETIDTLDLRNREHYKIKDVVRKYGSGTASIGLKRYYILVEGGKEAFDDLVLEVKEVRSPIPSYFLPYHEPFWQKYEYQGERVITTQKAMHHLEDPYLGYMTIDGKYFYVRERSPYKKKVKTKHVTSIEKLDSTLEIMGKITAKIHARADGDVQQELLDYHSEKEIIRAIGDDFETFCTQVTFISMSYKQQVIDDYALFCNWCINELHIQIEKEEEQLTPQ